MQSSLVTNITLFLGGIAAKNLKNDILLYKLKTGIKVDRLRCKNHDLAMSSNFQPDLEVRAKRNNVNDLQQIIISDSFDSIKNFDPLPDESGQTKLAQLNFNSQKKMGNLVARGSGTKLATKMLRNLGNFVETGSTAFNLGQGGVDVAAGHDMIENAQYLKSQGYITDSEYNEMVRNGRLRTAQGSFGVLDGMKTVSEFVYKKATKNINDVLVNPTSKVTKQLTRFAPVVGSAISVGVGATSMAKNAIAASDAAKQGNTGKTVMYGVMAAVDGITMILDVASLVTDVIFPPLSPIRDLVSVVLQVINGILGFFADMVDLRTT